MALVVHASEKTAASLPSLVVEAHGHDFQRGRGFIMGRDGSRGFCKKEV
jgi:hypothetical protein